MKRAFLLMTFLASTCFAEVNSITTDLEQRGPTSAEARRGKTLIVGTFADAHSTAVGLTMGKLIDSNTVFQIGIGSGKQHREGDIFKFSNAVDDQKVDLVTISLQKFFGNSFYVKGGLSHLRRSVNYQYGNTFFGWGDPNGPRTSYQYAGRSAAATLALGNQWQWNYLTLGLEWAAGRLPFSVSIESEKALDGYGQVSDYAQTEMKKDQDTYLRKADVSMAFYAGLAF